MCKKKPKTKNLLQFQRKYNSIHRSCHTTTMILPVKLKYNIMYTWQCIIIFFVFLYGYAFPIIYNNKYKWARYVQSRNLIILYADLETLCGANPILYFSKTSMITFYVVLKGEKKILRGYTFCLVVTPLKCTLNLTLSGNNRSYYWYNIFASFSSLHNTRIISHQL